MKDWAKREVELACKHEAPDLKEGEWDYGVACYKSALKAYEALSEDGHSGFSWGITTDILNRLCKGLPLTPITDEDFFTYKDIGAGLNEDDNHLQCGRMSSLFRDVDENGKITYHDIDRCTCFDINNPNHTYGWGGAARVVDELFPITMPYMPKTKAYKVACSDCLSEEDNGDYDTSAIYYIITPEGDRVDVNKYYGEIDGKMVEISSAEYIKRVVKANSLLKRELMDMIWEEKK